jgi:hypothetical protein
MPFFVRDGGAWLPVGVGSDRFAVRDGGSWKSFYVQFAVSLAGTQASHSQTRLNNTCFAGISLLSSGNEFSWDSDGTQSGTSLGPWLEGGEASQVWVRATLNSGSVSGTFNTWLALTTSRFWSISDTTDNGVAVTASLTLELARDSGGSDIVDTANYNLSAEQL